MKGKNGLKLVFGVGVYEKGKYSATINRKITKEYNTWNGVLERCYSKKLHQRSPTYIGCAVSEDFIYFQQFAEWYYDNYYKVEGERMELDKDILVKNNKIYSKETCIFIPKKINTLLLKNEASRGNDLIGVHWHKQHKKFQSYCNSDGKLIHLGYFDTELEAFNVYANFKKKKIMQMLEKYAKKIPLRIYEKIYKSLSKYKIEITD